MSRIIHSKWLAVCLVASSFAALGLGAFVAARAPAGEAADSECVDCHGKIPILTNPDGSLNADSVAAAKAEGQRIQEARMEEGRRQALEKFNTWYGTKGYVPDSVPDGSRPLYDAVARIFDGDLPAPDERLRQFAHFIEGQPAYKCVGWRAGVVSVTPNESGWEATVHVSPELASREGGVIFTPQNTVEKWQIAPNGTAAVLDVRQGDGLAFIFGD